jgi:hypothetical protein
MSRKTTGAEPGDRDKHPRQPVDRHGLGTRGVDRAKTLTKL